MSFRSLFASAILMGLATAATAQDAPSLRKVSLKIGLSGGQEIGPYIGADFKLARLPIRLDADAWSSFREFGDRSAGVALTVNYVNRAKGLYYGVGVGYARVRERGEGADTVATKFTLGAKAPFFGADLESSVIWTQHAIGSSHTVGTVALVWRR